MENIVNYTQKYDIFLSYRRDGGEAMAILLRDRLTAKGYSVFLDIENLNAGSFNTKLFDVIDNCKDFLLVCSIGSLDRCVNEGDWVRLEIAHALQQGKNIVPIMLRSFHFPDVLPADIEAVRMQNGVNANSHEYFDAAIDRLAEKFLTAKPMISIPLMTERLHELINQSVKPKPKKRKFSKILSIVFAVFVVVFTAVMLFPSREEYIEITVHNNTTNTMQSISFKRSDSMQWGANLAAEPLLPDETIIVQIPRKDTELGVTWDMRCIMFLGDVNRTYGVEAFTMYSLIEIIIYIDENGDYAREFIRSN
jgi:hypothetical protein